MCARHECDNTRLRRLLTLRAHSRFHQVCHVIVGFHVLCVDLVFHVVIGVGRLTVQREGFVRQLNFTTHSQFQVQRYFSGCCSPTLSCRRQLKLYTKFLHVSHRENGSFEVLSSHQRLGYPEVLNPKDLTPKT